jgi:hypothetical protein
MASNGGWRRLRRRVSGRGIFFLLLICPAVFSSCSKSDEDVRQTPQAVQQQAGDLPVRILPEVPTSSDSLFAMFSGPGPAVYSWEKNGSVIEGETTPRLSPSRFAKLDKVTVVVQSGGKKGSATVIIGNSPPKVTSVSFLPAEIQRGVDITAVPKASDPDGDEVRFSYKWSVNGEVLSNYTPVLKGDRFKRGDKVSLTVIPSDSESAGPPYETQPVTVKNASPWFDSTPPLDFSGATYTYHAVARDPDGDPLTYSLASAPQGMNINSGTGMITWPVTSGDTGTHLIEVIARDPDGAQVTQRYSLTIRLKSGSGQ